MQIISKANDTILRILRPFHKHGNEYRWLQYCIITSCENKQLIFNLMTREMICLSEEEYNNFDSNQYLKDHWFVVPHKTKEKEYVDIIKLFVKKQQGDLSVITNYSVFTTTDCNARCFYCYESGCSKNTMNNEMCDKIVNYIKAHCDGKSIRINWFGGEPLLNTTAIDNICNGLQQEGIAYRSKMISNGYLFDEITVQKAATQWNLQEIQITLDGTENIYNKVKDYIYKEGNPYQIVLSNIQRLLDANIPVSIRMNLDLYNKDDLLILADELANRFDRKQKLYVYVHKLFQEKRDYSDAQAAEECAKLESAVQQIEKKLTNTGLMPRKGIPKAYKMFYCMADCGNAITFLPTGNIGLCEIYTDSEFIGHIDGDGFDESVINSWKEITPEVPACKSCAYYPECYSITKCASASVCYPAYQKARIDKLKDQMLYEFETFMAK